MYVKRLITFAVVLVTASASSHLVQAEDVPPHKTNEERLALVMTPDEQFRERLKSPPEYVDGEYLHPKIQYWQEIRGRSKDSEEAVLAYRQRFLAEETRAAARKQIDDSWIAGIHPDETGARPDHQRLRQRSQSPDLRT